MTKTGGLIAAVFVLEISIVAVYLLLLFGGIPFGITAYVIESGSMEPSITTGSVVYVDRNIDVQKMAPNEVAAFNIDGANTRVCTHRVVANDTESQSIRTKGDGNKESDPTPIPYTSIIGRAVFSIPYLGYAAHLVTQNRLLVLSIYIGSLVLTFASYGFIQKRDVSKPVRQNRDLRRSNTYGIKRCNAG